MKKTFTAKIMPALLASVLVLGLNGCVSGNRTAESLKQTESMETAQTARTAETETTETEILTIDSPEKNAAVKHLLDMWSDYLQLLDKIYASQLWAFDYVEHYVNSGDWNDLAKARTACIASAHYLSELAMTEEDLTEEEYLILADAGIDIAYQTDKAKSIQESQEEAHRLIREFILEYLETHIFYSRRVDLLNKQISINREYIQCMSEYECATVNYMLLSLEDERLAQDYWTAMPEKYPALCRGYRDWIGNEKDLMDAGDAYLDGLDAVILKQSDLTSGLEAELYTMNQIIENKDAEKLLSSAFIMKNTPELLPMPEWYDPQTAGYLSFVLNPDGSIRYPESGDVLEDEAYGMYIQITELAEEDIDWYIGVVKDLGQDAWRLEGENKWYIRMPDYNVQISLENGTAALIFNGQDVTFAPPWYLKL
ncbi:hypothetical protein GPL15_24660 [Clostridium sp. MCC353]|uniref:hypothetical protein n=1 Tax=Clostridium sp. MCC353 TaxID=2592646 RepID=UPI001C01F2D7|nr:hypothetical protein [Clostridium sp. MCC353]MBT9779671.1 hypothetical protein [Clostridium sp. MCC353]